MTGDLEVLEMNSPIYIRVMGSLRVYFTQYNGTESKQGATKYNMEAMRGESNIKKWGGK